MELMRARHRLSKLLLRHGHRFDDGNAWTDRRLPGPDLSRRRRLQPSPHSAAAAQSRRLSGSPRPSRACGPGRARCSAATPRRRLRTTPPSGPSRAACHAVPGRGPSRASRIPDRTAHSLDAKHVARRPTYGSRSEVPKADVPLGTYWGHVLPARASPILKNTRTEGGFSEPTRGLEPRTPSLRMKCSTS
jgi:hypothetical protein